MSRSQNNELVSPTKRYFEWKSDDKCFKSYNKETKLNEEAPKPFRFLVLDQLTTIKGWSDSDQSGFWSNEIRDLKTEILVVRTKNGIEMRGTYEQVKEKLGARGADYCKSVYVAYYEGKNLVIGNIQMKGCAIGAWIEFCKGKNLMTIAIEQKGTTEGKKGKTSFNIPTFNVIEITEETNQKAIELDKELQEYLTLYFGKSKEEIIEAAVEIEEVEHKPIKSSRETSSFDKPNQVVSDLDLDLPF